MQVTHAAWRALGVVAASMATAAIFAGVASAQPQAGDVLVIDTDVPPVSTAVLFQVDPQTGARTVLQQLRREQSKRRRRRGRRGHPRHRHRRRYRPERRDERVGRALPARSRPG